MTHNEKVLALLADGKPHVHHELYALNVIAHSRVAELRKRGHEIAQWRHGDDYIYQLVSSPHEAARPLSDPPPGEAGQQLSLDSLVAA